MEYSLETVLFAFALTLFAGLATGIGSLLAFYTKKTNKKFLATALGFSAGVMIYVSFVEIFPKAEEALREVYSDKIAMIITVLAFFGGVLLTAIIDKFVPSAANPHEVRSVEDLRQKENDNLMRVGLFSALAIAIHNFPEGLATFASALQDPKLGISIAIAVAIHNVPEGIAVSVPIYHATGDKRKAFLYSFGSGLSEPVGAIIGFVFLRQVFSPTIFGILFAAVAGMMVYISLDELLPTAEKYGEHHLAIYGLISGMAVMAISLILF